jgi:hypothetical protein
MSLMNGGAGGMEEGGGVCGLENVSSKYDPRSARAHEAMNEVQDARLLPP